MAGLVQPFLAEAFGGGPNADALTDLRRRVGHDAHDGVVAEGLAHGVNARAGHNRHHHLPRLQSALQFLQHVAQNLGFHGEDHDLPGLRRQHIVASDPDAAQVVQLLLPLLARVAGRDMVGRHQSLGQESLDHGLGHDPAADEGNAI